MERYRSGRNGIDSKSIWGSQAPTGVRIPLSPPRHNPVKSKEVQKPIRNSGFFVAIRPTTCYYVLQNTPILGIREGVIYTQKLSDTPKKGECNAKAYNSIIRHEGSKSKNKR